MVCIIWVVYTLVRFPHVNIILIDDDQDILDTLQDALSQWGYQSKTYSNEHEALQALKDFPERFQIAIVDLRICQRDGVKMAKEILENTKKIKVVFMTADEISNEIRQELNKSLPPLSHSPHVILSKPFTLIQLHSLLES
jgi:DNA-binding NtrC family response regulator